MTITPTAPTPAGLPAPGAAATADPALPGLPGDFLALVQKALADVLGGTPDSAGTGAGAAGTPGAPGAAGAPGKPGATQTGTATAPGTDPTADPALAAAAAGLTALVAPVVATQAAVGTVAATGPATSPVTGPTTGPTTGTAAGSATGVAVTDGAAIAAPTAPVTPAVPGAATPARAAGASDAGHTTPVSAEAAADVGGGTGPQAPAAPVSGQAGHRSGDSTDPGAARQDAVPVPTASNVAGPAPTAPTTAPAPAAAPAAPAPVTGQVFPEVTSLVSRGDGVHRITLTLKPEALGEVRVVMTVRDGAVHVRLAAGHDAQQALIQGSPELSRLLEHAGATDTRIVVRDLFAAAAPTTGASTDTGHDPGHGPDLGQGQGLGAGSNRSQDQHAGTRAEHHATDGRHDTNTGGATLPRSAQTVTHTRTSGVDVTM